MRSHLPLLLGGCLDPVSAVRHHGRSPLHAVPSPTVYHTHKPVYHSHQCGVERRASLLCSEASATRPYWRKQGPDDCLQSGTVAMVTGWTCTGYVHVIALFAGRQRKRPASNFRWISFSKICCVNIVKKTPTNKQWLEDECREKWMQDNVRERGSDLMAFVMMLYHLSRGFHTCSSAGKAGVRPCRPSVRPQSATILIMRWWCN